MPLGNVVLDLDYNVILAYLFGLLLLYIVARLLFIPIKYIVRLIYNAVLGALAIWVINLVGGFAGIAIPINPITALAVGLLGIPGVVLILLLQYLLS